MDRLMKAGLDVWPDLAAQAGLAASEWTARPIARRSDRRVEMIVLRFDGPGAPLVLKRELLPQAPEGFAAAVQCHLTVQEAFPDGVPALLAVDLERQASLMEFAEGLPLAVALQEHPDRQEALLERAGHWLGGFHRATLADTRVFQPKYTLNYLEEIIGEVRSGARDIIAPDRFLACAEALCRRAAFFSGRKTVAAMTHGDLHMRNILMGPTVVGIDFTGGHVVPVGHDIGRLLSDFAILRARHDDIRPGEVLPDGVRDAFFRGYDLVGPEDPSVQLLLRHRVLAEWWGLPVAGLSVAQERRWAGISSLSRRIFPGH